uniref:Secreted protein n=1 Tax=Aegilops tauschii subsp. strangulata TaxID=200361 RepID=A0A453S9N9_AEGTS
MVVHSFSQFVTLCGSSWAFFAALAGMPQAAGGRASDAGRDGTVRGPEDALLPAAPRTSASQRLSGSTSRWPGCWVTRCSPRPRAPRGHSPPPSPTTSRSTQRRLPSRTPSLPRASPPTSPPCLTL